MRLMRCREQNLAFTWHNNNKGIQSGAVMVVTGDHVFSKYGKF